MNKEKGKGRGRTSDDKKEDSSREDLSHGYSLILKPQYSNVVYPIPGNSKEYHVGTHIGDQKQKIL